MDITEKDYLRHYHAFLNPWKEMDVRVLEIAGSQERLDLWSGFFPNGTVFPGTASDEELSLDYHLILDSRSESHSQLASFASLFPRVIPGGYYCIENVGASLDKNNWGGKRGTLGAMNQLLKDMHASQHDPAMALTYPELSPRVDFVFTAPGLIVVRRNKVE